MIERERSAYTCNRARISTIRHSSFEAQNRHIFARVWHNISVCMWAAVARGGIGGGVLGGFIASNNILLTDMYLATDRFYIYIIAVWVRGCAATGRWLYLVITALALSQRYIDKRSHHPRVYIRFHFSLSLSLSLSISLRLCAAARVFVRV